MKKKLLFVIKCIFVILPFVLFSFYCKYNMLKFGVDEAEHFVWNKDFCAETHEKQYDVVILGDSTSNAAYAPEVLSDNTLNLALGGTIPLDAYYIMKEWLENNKAPKTVYISFFDYHFNVAEMFWGRTMYSHRFDAKTNIEILKNAKKYNEPSIVTNNYLIDYISYQLYLPNKYITSVSNAGINQRYESNKMSYEDDYVFNGRYIARGVYDGGIPESPPVYYEFKMLDLFEEYYTKLIEMCIDEGIQVRLVKLPVANYVSYTDEYIQQVNTYYEELIKKYPEITFDWFENLDYRCFTDDKHMNNHGAIRFSRMLKERYPNDFNSEISENRMNALNRNIIDENWLEDMFMWNDCGQYTFLIDDDLGKFEELFNDTLKTGDLVCNNYEDIDGLYAVGKGNLSENMPNITQNENMIQVHLGEQTYDWNMFDINGIQILVIDNYNNNIVCEKNFRYVENSYYQLS